jgi:hypothetical protein
VLAILFTSSEENRKEKQEAVRAMNGIAMDAVVDPEKCTDTGSPLEKEELMEARPSTEQPQHHDTSSMDSVSRLQIELALLCERLFVTIGSLQRDAPPESLHGEDVCVDRKSAESLEQQQREIRASAEKMGLEVKESLGILKKCIDELPDGLVGCSGSEGMFQEGGDGELEGLMVKSRELDDALRLAIEKGQGVSQGLESVHSALVDALLLIKSNE